MNERPVLEVADIVRQHGAEFLNRHAAHLGSGQRRFLRDVARCRTAALGGHVERCGDCGQERIAYNSCRNRHCPKCQGAARARWLARETTFLLPVEYHHVVFTLPAEQAEVMLVNQRVLYGLLFHAVRDTLLEVAADPHWLGVQPGVLLVLHTWGQNLHYHPHVHGVVTGGGLSCNVAGMVTEEPEWRACRPGFLLPVRVLSRVFRGKFLAGLRLAHERGELVCPKKLPALAEASALARWLTPLYQKDWVVYAKPPFGGPAQVLKYLARYTHRVAISNQRLLSLDNGQVTFRYKDYAEANRAKRLTLSADEFLRRLVFHVLPRGFVKIRHYGLLANRQRALRLDQARTLLVAVTVGCLLAGATLSVKPVREQPACPFCGSQRLERSAVARQLPPTPVPADTS
jgi:hypothetical protein